MAGVFDLYFEGVAIDLHLVLVARIVAEVESVAGGFENFGP